MVNVSEIIQRLKDHLDVKTNVALAEVLGVTKATVGKWVSRNTIDYSLILDKFPDMDMNWLLLGKDIPERGVSLQELEEMEEKIRKHGERMEIVEEMLKDAYAKVSKLEAENKKLREGYDEEELDILKKIRQVQAIAESKGEELKF